MTRRFIVCTLVAGLFAGAGWYGWYRWWPVGRFVRLSRAQIVEQPASTTAAQVLSQPLNLDDPVCREEVGRVLKESCEVRRAAAQERAKQLDIRPSLLPDLEDFDEDGRPVFAAKSI